MYLLSAFERAKHEREVDIVDKLIREEERLRKMKDKLNEPHWKPRETSTKPQVCICESHLCISRTMVLKSVVISSAMMNYVFGV